MARVIPAPGRIGTLPATGRGVLPLIAGSVNRHPRDLVRSRRVTSWSGRNGGLLNAVHESPARALTIC